MVGAAAPGRAAVFLDRDGVIVVPEFRDGRSFAPTALAGYRFYPDAAENLARLKAAGFLLVVVTNQPDVGKGVIPRAVMDEMHRRIVDAMPVDAVKACTHRQTDGCACRKPSPGMLVEAAGELGISFDRSFMVGDRASDVAAGAAVGCRTVFIDLGYVEPGPEEATFTVRSLREATDVILGAAPPDGADT
jgi:D-glycero-D-manno-heptose 1,7-bisphosphate phosphatase